MELKLLALSQNLTRRWLWEKNQNTYSYMDDESMQKRNNPEEWGM